MSKNELKYGDPNNKSEGFAKFNIKLSIRGQIGQDESS